MKLNKNSVKLLGCIGFVLIVLNATPNTAQQRFCGPVISAVLNSLCKRGFNPMIPSEIEEKRSGNNRDFRLDMLADYNEINDMADGSNAASDVLPHPYDNSALLDKMFGSAQANFLTKTRRRRRIHEECCMKPCTLSELSSYCL